MLRPAPPMSNAERQRKFQRAHPGYDRRRKSRRRSMIKQAQEQRLAAMQAATVQVLRIPTPTTRLALPAPVESPAMAAINELCARNAAKDSLPAAARSRV